MSGFLTKKELLDTVRARKLAYYGHTMRKQAWRKRYCKEQARKATHGLDGNIKTWIGLSMEESIRVTKDRDKNVESTSMVWPTFGSRTAKDKIR